MAASAGARFRALLTDPQVLLLPGVYDALSARLVERSGYGAAYISGSAVAMSLLGLPDFGLMSGTEMIEQARRIAAAVEIPLICDADTGYGNAVNVRHSIRGFEAAGVAGVQLEDQTFPKRCGHFAGKSLVSTEEMVGKIRAAVAARMDPDFVIVARTDAIAVVGVEAAIARAHAFAAAGADVLFVEAPETVEQMEAIGRSVDMPKMINVVEGGRTPQLAASEYGAMGFSIVLYPTGAVRVAAKALDSFYRHLATAGTSVGFAGGMIGFEERNHINDLGSHQEWEGLYVPAVDASAGSIT